jgi:hypothetical protein
MASVAVAVVFHQLGSAAIIDQAGLTALGVSDSSTTYLAVVIAAY